MQFAGNCGILWAFYIKARELCIGMCVRRMLFSQKGGQGWLISVMQGLGVIWCRRCGKRGWRRIMNCWIEFLRRRRGEWYAVFLSPFVACFCYGWSGLTGDGCKAEQATKKILNKLTPDITADRNKQSELATVLHDSSPPATLLASIEAHIPNPTPVLALSLTRAYKQSGEKEAAVKFAKSYLSRYKESGYKSPDVRQFLVLKITFARYQGTLCFDSGITLFQKTIAEFTQYLGETHICTLQARFECAQLWFQERGSVKTALIQCVEILRTLYHFGNESGDGIINFNGHWKNKALELIQTCKGRLGREDPLRRRVDVALEQMNLLWIQGLL